MNVAEFIYTVLLRPRPLRIAANALLRVMLPSTCSVNGALIRLNPDDPVVSGALTLGVYENEEIAFFERMIEPEMIFVDVPLAERLCGFDFSPGHHKQINKLRTPSSISSMANIYVAELR